MWQQNALPRIGATRRLDELVVHGTLGALVHALVRTRQVARG